METKYTHSNDSIDIIEKLTNFVSYLKVEDKSQMLLKSSEIELQNEIKFKERAEKILKHHHRHDQTVIEEKMIKELQQDISNITSDLENQIDKEKLESKNIGMICDKVMILKLLNIKDSKNVKYLEDFIKFNKISLKDINKMEKEIKCVLDKLSIKEKQSKKSETKNTRPLKISRDHKSSISLSNASRRNDRDANSQVHLRSQVEHARREGITNEDIIIVEPQTNTNELFSLRLESDHIRVVDNLVNQSITDQNTRYKPNEDLILPDFMMGNIVDDLSEFSSLNSAVNLYKDNEDNNNGDVHLILVPPNNWIDA